MIAKRNDFQGTKVPKNFFKPGQGSGNRPSLNYVLYGTQSKIILKKNKFYY